MIRPPAWTDPALVNAAIDLTTDVRDLDPEMLRREVAKIPPDTLAGLAVVLAAMVDVHQPMTALTEWSQMIPPDTRRCRRGHYLTADNIQSNGRGTDGERRWMCRRCLLERRGRERAA